MASIAKESLSPLIKSASVRRRSLEICQKIGNQLLSPTNLTTLFSPKSKSPSSVSPSSDGSSRTTSPFQNTNNSGSKFLSPVFLFESHNQNGHNSGTETNSNYHYKRRASDSLWIDTLPKVSSFGVDVDAEIQQRRRSLTPQDSYKRAQFFGNEQSAYLEHAVSNLEECKPSVTCNIIPPTPVKSLVKLSNTSHLECSLKRLSSESNDSDTEDTDVVDKTVATSKKRIKVQTWDLNEQDECERISPRKYSAGAKYDLDESLINFVEQHWNLTLSPEELLGKGSFGTVVAGIYKDREVAVKVLKTSNSSRKASLIGEENALTLPFHNHIARTIDIFRIEPDRALIVMEKMHKGSLINLLHDPSFEVCCSLAINFAKQIALALMFCHRQGLLHLDVKPHNILVDLNNCCKLSDFGSSKRISDLDNSYKFPKLDGTVPYTAPELFRGSKPTEKCDVYSLAITMWQILTREMPYEDENEHSVIFRVVSQGLRPKECLDANNNDGSASSSNREKLLVIKYSALYKQAWQTSPDARPNMTEIHASLVKIQLLT